VQQDRYCRNCGQELQPEDQFCANCGRPVHATATVPTPEADVPIPPPPQQAQDSSVPSQAPQAQSSEEVVQSATRGPMWGMLTVFLVMGIGVPVREIPRTLAGLDIGSQIATGVVLGIVSPVIPATLVLLVGGVYYVMARKDGVTFREAIFNWPLVILAGIVAFLSLL
jgi:hypothetical protein